MNIGDVIQFNDKHKWCGSFGIINNIKIVNITNEQDEVIRTDKRYLIEVPIPKEGIAYIYVMESEEVIEYIGKAIYVLKEIGDLKYEKV